MEEREHVVGKSVTRVDALEKVTGRAKYTEDLCDKSAYIARVLHADIAHGIVRSVDTSEAQKLSGVVKIVTCFDVPKYYRSEERRVGKECRSRWSHIRMSKTACF